MRYKAILISLLLTFALCTSGCSKSISTQYLSTSENNSIESVISSETPEITHTETIVETITEEVIEPETTVPEPEEVPPPSVTLVMVGDILLHTPVEESALQEDGSYNFDAVFANVKEEIEAADLALVNQEVILGGVNLGISGYPAFNAPHEAGDALANAGFDIILQGTNHALDKGKKGLVNCLDFWAETYPEISVLGINESQEEQDSIYIYEQEGIRIAILNYTYGTNGIPLPADMPYAVDLLEKEKVIKDLQTAEEMADFTIVCPHWGTEYKLEASSEQKNGRKFFWKTVQTLCWVLTPM